jgi:hypothetical protein
MFTGNLYGVIITILTLIAAVVITAREVGDTGLRFELTIQRLPSARPEGGGQDIRAPQPRATRPETKPESEVLSVRAKS